MRSKKVFSVSGSSTTHSFGSVVNNSQENPPRSNLSNVNDHSDSLNKFQFSQPFVANLWSPVEKSKLILKNTVSSKNPASIYKTARSYFDSQTLRVKIIPSNFEKRIPYRNIRLKSSSLHQTKNFYCLADIISLIFFFILRKLYKLYELRKEIARIILLSVLLFILFISCKKLIKNKSFEDSTSNSLFSLVNHALSYIKVYNKANFSPFSAEELSCTEKLISIIHAVYLIVSDIILNSVTTLYHKTYSIVIQLKEFLKQATQSNKSELKSIAIEAVEEMFNEITENIQYENTSQNTHSRKYQLKPAQGKFNGRKLEKCFPKLCNVTEMQFIELLPKAIEESYDSSKYSTEKEPKSDQKNLTPFERSLLTALRKVFYESGNKKEPSNFLNEWLNLKLLSKQKKINQNLKSDIETLKKSILYIQHEENLKTFENEMQKDLIAQESNPTYLKRANDCLFNKHYPHSNHIKKVALVSDYNETILPDYALESAGGSILSSRCSESYSKENYKISLFGFNLWTRQHPHEITMSPKIVIQPSLLPGQCWAFEGSEGFLVIKLAHQIFLSGFTLEHIPVHLSPSTFINSSPKDFSVLGLVSEYDHGGILLGRYTYDVKGYSSQYFRAQFNHSESFSYVELKIHSNNGNPEYTCLYRFRVHGKFSQLPRLIQPVN